MFAQLFRSLAKPTSPRPRRSRQRRIEKLEERWTPAVAVWIGSQLAPEADWNSPSCWSTGQVPGANDIAHFTSGEGIYTPKVNVTGNVTVAGITTDTDWGGAFGGNLNIPAGGNLTVSGNLSLVDGAIKVPGGKITLKGASNSWSGGLISLGGGTIVNQGTFNIDTTTGNRQVSQAGTIINQGRINLSGNPDWALDLVNGAKLRNETGAMFDIKSDSDVRELFTGYFENYGSVLKSAGTGLTDMTVIFNNFGGSFTVNSGRLQMSSTGGMIKDPIINVASGATYDFAGGNGVTYSGTATGTGLGIAVIDSGAVVVPATGLAFNMPGSMLQWSSGNIDLTSGGTLTNLSSSAINVKGANMDVIGSGTIQNNGALNVQASTNLRLVDDVTINNNSTGVLDFQGNGRISQISTGKLNSSGLIRKTVGTGRAVIAATFNTTNANLDVQAGTLALQTNGGVINGVSVATSKGAVLELANIGTVDYAGIITGSGSGTIRMNREVIRAAASGLTFNVPGSMLRWSGGSLDVSRGSITNLGQITIEGATGVSLVGSGTLINSGKIINIATGSLVIGGESTLDNQLGATFELRKDSNISGDGTFKNLGLLKKSGGSDVGTSFLTTVLDNVGTVFVQQGNLTITNSLVQLSGTSLTAGTWNVISSGGNVAGLAFNSASGGIVTLGGTAKVTLSGATSTFPQLANLSSLTGGASLVLLKGADFITNHNLSSAGRLTIDATSVLRVNNGLGELKQSSTSILTIAIGGTNLASSMGKLLAGKISLAGRLNLTSTVQPAKGTVLTLATSKSPIVGKFSNLGEGASTVVNGVTWRISYAANSGKAVTLTAI